MKNFGLVILIIMAFTKASYAGSISEKILSSSPDEVKIYAKELATTLSKELPKRIDKTTVFRSFMFVEYTNTIIYSYNSSTKIDKKSMANNIINHTCNDPVRSAFIKKGITIQHIYSFSGGKANISVNKETCENIFISDSGKEIREPNDKHDKYIFLGVNMMFVYFNRDKISSLEPKIIQCYNNKKVYSDISKLKVCIAFDISAYTFLTKNKSNPHISKYHNVNNVINRVFDALEQLGINDDEIELLVAKLQVKTQSYYEQISPMY